MNGVGKAQGFRGIYRRENKPVPSQGGIGLSGLNYLFCIDNLSD